MVGDSMTPPNDANNAITQVSLPRIATLYPGIRPLAFRILQDVYTVTTRRMNVVQAMRSMDAQLALYGQGRALIDGIWTITDSGKIVTNARPGLSWHSYGLAFDSAWQGTDPYLNALREPAREELWEDYGKCVTSNGMKWGGDFHLVNGVADLPHAELAYGLTIDQALEIYQHGGLAAVWAFCDQVRGVPHGQGWLSPGGDPILPDSGSVDGATSA